MTKKKKKNNNPIPSKFIDKCKPFFKKKTLVKKVKRKPKKGIETTADRIEKLTYKYFKKYMTKEKRKASRRRPLFDRVRSYGKRTDYVDKKRDHLKKIALHLTCKDWKKSKTKDLATFRKAYMKIEGVKEIKTEPVAPTFDEKTKPGDRVKKYREYSLKKRAYDKGKNIMSGKMDNEIFARQLRNNKAAASILAHDEDSPAFYDSYDEEIHAHKPTEIILIHEAIHHYASKKFKETFKKGYDEAVTQHFTYDVYWDYRKKYIPRKKGVGVTIPASGYDGTPEYEIISKLKAQKKMHTLLKKAYFTGDPKAINILKKEITKLEAKRRAKEVMEKAKGVATEIKGKNSTPQKGKTTPKP